MYACVSGHSVPAGESNDGSMSVLVKIRRTQRCQHSTVYLFTHSVNQSLSQQLTVSMLSLSSHNLTIHFHYNNNNNNTQDDIYSAVIMTRSLREFTRFIW